MVLRLFFLLCLFFALPAPSVANEPHIRSAFTYAERGDWNNALAHAKASGDAALVKLVTWQYVMDADSMAPFAEITRFIDDNPHWPEQKKLRLRAEQSLRDDTVPDHDILAWFNGETPVTGIGRIALAEAWRRGRMADGARISELLREAWRGGDFDEAQEKNILAAHGRLLTAADHIARLDRLLWEEKTAPAKRMLPLVPEAHEKMFKARIALISDSRLASMQLALVPSSLKNDPGLVYDRMRYRARRKDDRGVRDMLAAAPASPPYPEKWWRYREMQVREFIAARRYGDALKLLAAHGQVQGTGLADALWLQGWIRCEFQDSCRPAYDDFAALYEKVRYPVSRARAAYWAGRAAYRSGDQANAAAWYARAGAYATTFYGQLGLLKSGAAAPLELAPPPPVSESDRSDFERNDAVKAVRLALKFDQTAIAGRLVNAMIDSGESDAQMAQLADLGIGGGHAFLSVRAAKKALQQNVVLLRSGYPLPSTPKTGLERPLTLAITRQESEFDPRARSPSGALGMMQLLPSTAKEVAKKNAIAYAAERLYEPAYNMTLGSLYLKRLIDSYDGSYVLAIGAYNAGPGNVRKWVQSFGTPENDMDRAVNWIETVPFAETRNYIQRVLENLQVYRAVEGGSAEPLQLGADLKR